MAFQLLVAESELSGDLVEILGWSSVFLLPMRYAHNRLLSPPTTKVTGGNGAQRNCLPDERIVSLFLHAEYISCRLGSWRIKASFL